MQYENYNQLADKIRQNHFLTGLIHYSNIIFTALGYIMYPALLLKLAFEGSYKSLAICILVPGLSFLAVSVFRKLCHVKRPYEVYPITPLIKREKNGDSFPSRHTFSIFLIGGVWYIFNPLVGSIILTCGLFLGLIRVIGGVHYVKDILCGAALGLAASCLVSCLIKHII